MPRSELCKLFQSYLTYSIAKDTLIKEIVNDELIVSVIDIKATSHNILIQDKVVTVNFFTNVLDKDVDVDEDDEINEVLTVHLVNIIVPFFLLEHRSVLDRKCPRQK